MKVIGPVVVRVETEQVRAEALSVLRATYAEEKGWVDEAAEQFPPADLSDRRLSWFLVRVHRRPVGVLRVFYDPPIARYTNYRVTLLDQNLDVEAMLAQYRIAEIGRFAVIPTQRRRMVVAVALIRAATMETIRRGYTHYLTDVFEDDPHSPYGFHTRVLGFTPVATHEQGELYCRSRRITLLLDLKSAYRRLRAKGNWVFRFLTHGWEDALHNRLI